MKLALAITVAFTPAQAPPVELPNPQGRQFIVYDTAGDGRAVEVIGDLSRAQRIVVLVPGVDTTLRDFDRGLGGVERRAPAVQARALHAATGNDPSVAVIAWLGYDPPEGLSIAAAREERAQAGAVELQRFLTTLPAHAPKVLVGHSYGSTVIGLAAPHLGPDVTDIAAIASPGMGVSHASELRTKARVWATTSENDWIRRVPNTRLAGFGHGADPTQPGFGARILPSDGVSNHDSYFVPESATLKALARLALGDTV